ncbi:MAG: YbaB/EbfC family nucleoid-associated protein [Treponema sp.]|jgi:DNA-binding YbaB/EbfC family protein|nr:YbaB/EbfC family nucleoid-associated protein [Treponema sp.]
MQINPFDILKNTQKIQEQMGAFQEKLGGITVTGSAGGGMVEVDINGRMEILGVRILPEAADGKDMEMLQDLVAAAFTGAVDKVKEVLNHEMGSLMGIPGMPPGFPGGFPGFGAPGAT